MSAIPVVLSFGVSDASGASGLAADHIAIASMGCHAASIVTAITMSDEHGTAQWLGLDEEWIEGQAQAVLQDMAISAFKVGALGSSDQVQPIAAILADYDSVAVVLDPSLDAPLATTDMQVGDDAAQELALALRELLLPQATVLVVNLPQARRLVALGNDANADPDADDDRSHRLPAGACAQELVAAGAGFVLITDAEPGSALVVNALYDASGLVRTDTLPRLEGVSTRVRGAGDTLSAALAGLLAQGLDMPDAAQEASQYTAAALLNALDVGLGVAIPDRLFWAGEDEDDDADGGGDVAN